ncbi:DUF1801 domain-containing protein [Neptunicella sp. SCSIO 80796]|uniref:DUF1801 domain-containing protein n=1 Tax=Neptunicella plasticusilytica TaxID=3117012 RepID=UPI003A4D99E8
MDDKVKQKFLAYPEHVRPLMLTLRELILDVASQPVIGEVVETLKWGEPSYIAKHGSTLRFDWKKKSPDQYALYFNCNTRLVETFKEIYDELFSYEGHRAIVFQLNDKIPATQLQHCIELSLKYHRVKHLPLLGC